MKVRRWAAALLGLGMLAGCGRAPRGPAIYVGGGATKLERLGAAELRRYLYLCTGALSPVVEIGAWAEIDRPGIIISRDAAAALAGAGAKSGFDAAAVRVPKLGPRRRGLFPLDRPDPQSVRDPGRGQVLTLNIRDFCRKDESRNSVT